MYTKVVLKKKNVNYNELYLSSNHLWGDYTTNIEETVYEYYNIGFGDLKSVKYKNLVKDLAESPGSMLLLRKSQTYKNNSTMLYTTGIALLFFGFSNGFNNKENPDLKNASIYFPVGIGISSIWIGSIYSKKKTRLLRDAIKLY